MNSNDKIYITGHNGMVGSAIVRQLQTKESSQTTNERVGTVNRYIEAG
jgi:nucleoside-diphosphate-sugar epimerase